MAGDLAITGLTNAPDQQPLGALEVAQCPGVTRWTWRSER